MRFLLLCVLLVGCSDQSTPQPSVEKHVIVLAATDRATPQIGYDGPGSWKTSHGKESFRFEVATGLGKPWLTGNGKMQMGQSNDMTISIDSTSDRPYEIQLLGLAKTDVQSDDDIEETISVASGKQTLKVQRFLIHTYDFTKR